MWNRNLRIEPRTVSTVRSSLLATLSLAISAVAWTPPMFSRLDTLFLTAATGEPKFQVAREAAEAALRADSNTLTYLLARRLQGQTPRQQQYVERLFTLASDSGRNPRPRLLLTSALASVLSASPLSSDLFRSDTVRAYLLYLGSRLGDSAFLPTAVAHRHASYEPIRRMAVRSLGAYPRPSNIPLLWDGLFKTRGLELQQRLWALDAQGPLKNWKALVPLLSDSLYVNRRKVRDMMLKATDSSWNTLKTAMPAFPKTPTKSANNLRHEWRLLAHEAKGGKVFLEAERKEMSKEERYYFGLEI